MALKLKFSYVSNMDILQKMIRNLIALKMTFLHHKWYLMAQNWHILISGYGRQPHIRMGKIQLNVPNPNLNIRVPERF